MHSICFAGGGVCTNGNNVCLCFRWRSYAGTQAWWLWSSGEWMQYRDEDPQLESQEQSTQELEENFLLMKMAAGPHTVRPGSPMNIYRSR